jgi:uncharacterized protein (DUF305 family)
MPSFGMRVTVFLAAVVTATVVSSCHESAPIPGTQSPTHNAADVAFAMNMVPHHQQAVEMAAMVPSRTSNRELLLLAKHISVDQQAQIDTLRDWLGQWGEQLPPDHMGHAGMTGEGMVDGATMDKLGTLRDAPFDVLWLESMIRHHQGAVAMAKPEIEHGWNPKAVKMAKIIVDWQQLEIGRMHAMLGPSE